MKNHTSGGKYTHEAEVKAQGQSDRMRKGSLELKGKKAHERGTAQYTSERQERQNIQEKASIG